MYEAKDARSLSSGTPQEEAYAEYANKLKALGNQARKEMLATKKIEYSREAKNQYAKEVASLNAKLNVVLKNAPKERQAQTIAAGVVKAKVQDNPDITNAEKKKIAQQALQKARQQVGAKGQKITLTDSEWNAIQAGAISESKLLQIINKVDADELRQRATPRTTVVLSNAKINKINSMRNSGYTMDEIAKAIGVSTSTVSKYVKKERSDLNG